jgi:division protein CdvB (Snf7/Vps24/ESCRT-III family)
MTSETDSALAAAIARIEALLDRQDRRLGEIAARLDALESEVQRGNEAASRLKLLADLARESAAAQSTAMERLARLLEARSGSR